MKQARHLEASPALTIDIDTRMADLWREIDKIDEWTLTTLATFMRAAYGKGYTDALSEDVRGRLMREHGYKVPVRA